MTILPAITAHHINGGNTEMSGERHGTAFHEAGHAVVAWSLGLQVGGVAIGFDGDDTRGGAQIATEQGHLSLVDRLAVCLAGLEAQEFFDSMTHDDVALRDGKDAREIIEDSFQEDVPENEILRLLDAGYKRARELIVDNETRCRRLAADLEKRGQVSADEFRQLMTI